MLSLNVLTPVNLLVSMPVSPRAMLCISMVVRESATALPLLETLTCTGRREEATGKRTLRAHPRSKSRLWSHLISQPPVTELFELHPSQVTKCFTSAYKNTVP